MTFWDGLLKVTESWCSPDDNTGQESSATACHSVRRRTLSQCNKARKAKDPIDWKGRNESKIASLCKEHDFSKLNNVRSIFKNPETNH